MGFPDIITSGLSTSVELEELKLSIEIFRLELDTRWALEVVDQHGTSTVWDELFDTDKDAFKEATRVINEEGASAFRDGGNVVRFPPS
jgi:hypothetical protein